MHFFTDYIQPTTVWLHNHPHYALLITFIISFAESLAIIGSIVPGSVTMTAIGILAGSGVMRVDLTLLIAACGAIAGDSASYFIGFYYSDRLYGVWPFRHYPQWLAYGKDYFSRHGGKSVLIGRFIGPLRSITPVIAGMMHMSHWRFLIANVISAVAWSLLYILPGVLIGTASSELAPESATKLFVLVLVFLGILWLFSVSVKWLFVRINHFLRAQLHDFWTWSTKHPILAKGIAWLSPSSETNHYQTTTLCVTLFTSIICFILITIIVASGNLKPHFDLPVHLLLQSLRIITFDVLFIAADLITNPINIFTLFFTISFITAYYGDYRSLKYWISLNLWAAVLLTFTHLLIKSSHPEGLLEVQLGNSYPEIQLTFISADFAALLFFINKYCFNQFKKIINILLSLCLLLAGIAPVYLGDTWLTDCVGAYLGGFSISLLHWIFYRRYENNITYPIKAAIVILILLILSTTSTFLIKYEEAHHNHQPYLAQYVFTDKLWWNQQKPLLPVYRTNRMGKKISIFNLQYAGNLMHFEQALMAAGWQKQTETLISSLLKRLNGKSFYQDKPMLAQLYLNKQPVLIMVKLAVGGDPELIVRIWRSNYHLRHFRQPIWLGSIEVHTMDSLDDWSTNQFTPLIMTDFSNALAKFSLKQIPLAITIPNAHPQQAESKLLLIKESLQIRQQ